MRKKVQKRRPRKSNVLRLREGAEDRTDGHIPIDDGPARVELRGEPVPFTQFPKCDKCGAANEGQITWAYQRDYDVIQCSCVKCGHQWDMVPADKSGLKEPPPPSDT